MTFGNSIIAAGAVALLLAVGSVWVKAERMHSDNVQLQRDLQTQTQARDTAEWLLHSQEQTLQIFSAIRVANAAARREDERLRDETQYQITRILDKDECAQRIVPDDAAQWLQRVETRARAGSDNTITH
ncbi:DUF2570 domain-containing protein [Citrobacter portucalensis]|uniref:DUF2570 domain-containing protein n=1 Tax=Citrobacter portucalensis TaxID=1639133 RepID=UPI00226B0855|nr:DUF2570 domain-containing protein [Citrobacter portucalensis]MCX9039611.1 DUF2570 domain-containing protein [Citrobacter portucalensis]